MNAALPFILIVFALSAMCLIGSVVYAVKYFKTVKKK